MDVRVRHNWQKDCYDVYVFETPVREAGIMPRMHRIVGPDEWQIQDAGEGNAFRDGPVPSFSVPAPIMESLIGQVRKLTPSMNNDDAIADARAIRDRLLTLIELNTLDKAESPATAINILKDLRR